MYLTGEMCIKQSPGSRMEEEDCSIFFILTDHAVCHKYNSTWLFTSEQQWAIQTTHVNTQHTGTDQDLGDGLLGVHVIGPTTEGID